MRILRISLRNLNSLRGEHLVDLETEPLASSGIFAITGPTGAGKSTLLDAITLALFGRSARYGAQPNPEDVMSRHTGDCRAEVLFEIPQGRFTAAWHLNRARNAAEGKVQPAKRFIYDASGAALAQNITQADQKIVELTGLDYDRFLRSVLLAQGEFARFLKARADERSELLEQLTGTVVYSQLGVLAHEEKSRREQEFAAREQLLGSVALLSEEELNARRQQIHEHDSRLGQLGQEKERLAAALQCGRSLTECLAKIEGLKTRHDEFNRAIELHKPEFDTLARHRRTESFAGDLVRLDQQNQNLRRLEDHVVAAESGCKLSAGQLYAAFDDTVQLVEHLLAGNTDQAKQLAHELAAAEAGHAALSGWLELQAADVALQSTLPDLEKGLTSLVHHREEFRTLTRQSKTLAGTLAQARQALVERRDEADKSQAQLVAADQSFKAAQEAVKTALNGRTQAGLETALSDGQAEQQQLQELKALLAQRDEASGQMESLSKDIAGRLGPLEQIIRENEQLNIIVRQGSDLASALHESLRKSQLIASLEEHRSSLSHGEACPLCGALDHPFSGDEVQPASEITRLKAELDAASTELQKNQLAQHRKGNELARAEQSLTDLRKQESAGQAVYQRLQSTLASYPEHLHTLDALLAATTRQQQTTKQLEAALKQVRSAEAAAAAAEKAWLAQRHEVDTAQLREQAASEDVLRAEQAVQQNEAALEEVRARGKQSAGLLAAPLAKLSLETPAEGTEKEFSRQLAQRRDLAQAKVAERQQIQMNMQRLETVLAQFHRDAEGLQQQLKALAEDQTESLAGVPRPATRPLSGKPRHTALPQAQSALADARRQDTEARTTLREREQAAEQARVLSGEASASLVQALRDSEFDSVEDLRAARLSSASVERIATLEKRLIEEELNLAGHWQAAQADADALRATEPPQGEQLAIAEETLRDVEEDLQSRATSRALLQKELENDSVSRTTVVVARQQLEADRNQLEVWRQLAELIGSHDGKKFRVFAQGLSLDVLIRHANKHLQRLAERYRLRRRAGEALDLEIIDLHQAGVARPMASLSGGESFLASLALALGLSDLAGRNVRIDSLFIDEGFGSLDADTLDVAIAALESLRLNQKTVGIISHVDLLKERITTQVQVERGAGGISSILVKA